MPVGSTAATVATTLATAVSGGGGGGGASGAGGGAGGGQARGSRVRTKTYGVHAAAAAAQHVDDDHLLHGTRIAAVVSSAGERSEPAP